MWYGCIYFSDSTDGRIEDEGWFGLCKPNRPSSYSFAAISTIFPHIYKIAKRKSVSRVSIGADFDISILFLFTCLIEYLREKFLRKGLRRVLLGLVIFVLFQRVNRHNRFNFIKPLICINCGDPSLDSYLCVSIWPYPLLHSELLVLLRISAGIPFT